MGARRLGFSVYVAMAKAHSIQWNGCEETRKSGQGAPLAEDFAHQSPRQQQKLGEQAWWGWWWWWWGEEVARRGNEVMRRGMRRERLVSCDKTLEK